MINDTQLKQAGQRLESWQRTMILSHERPDGDALGAAGAMKRIIEAAGRQAEVLVFGPIPPRYEFLRESCGLDSWKNETPSALDGRFDGILIVDTSNWSQIEPAVTYLRSSSRPRVVLDHHLTSNHLFGRDAELLTLVDPTAASTCAMVWRWCQSAGWPIDATAGEALFTGLITDTGWFRFSNTDSETFQAATALLNHGVRPEQLYSRLYEFWSPGRLRLKAELLQSMQLLDQQRVAVTALPREAFERAAATQEDTEELVNETMSIGSVIISILLSEMPDGKIRVNLRSKAPSVCGLDVDVAAIAQSLGGGGHRRAAGVRMAGPLEKARTKITEAVIQALNQSDASSSG